MVAVVGGGCGGGRLVVVVPVLFVFCISRQRPFIAAKSEHSSCTGAACSCVGAFLAVRVSVAFRVAALALFRERKLEAPTSLLAGTSFLLFGSVGSDRVSRARRHLGICLVHGAGGGPLAWHPATGGCTYTCIHDRVSVQRTHREANVYT